MITRATKTRQNRVQTLKRMVFSVSIFAGLAALAQQTRPPFIPQPHQDEQMIVFSEDFEQKTLDSVFRNWHDVKNGEGMSFSADVPDHSPGNQSLRMTFNPGEDTGGHLYALLPQGYDSLYARYYVKFIPEHPEIHHLVQMGGYNPPSEWIRGGAGQKPEGHESFISGVEPQGNKWQWDFYTYWMGMHSGAAHRFYGNSFNPEGNNSIRQNEWICVEFMLKMNHPPEAHNGEQAFWIDGEKVLHLKKGKSTGFWVWDKFFHHPDSAGFEGFQWRNTEKLNINFFWLNYYVTRGSKGQVYQILFDDIVLSKRYIGPHTARKNPKK